MENSFIILCKQAYYNGITPANKRHYESEEYKKIADSAKKNFLNEAYEDFACGFLEGQYLIPLWTAHMLVEYGNPRKDLMVIALKTIVDYSDNPLAPKVAEEEREWLKENAEKYKEFI